ncbi:MAG TPA: 2-oxo acid dehydrogenase subunit E2 [Candidatus Agrococcus pullicola]|uniref:Dihydrolipoamide acetyltransferase component of pyruvate dehydrogenase complex n=1 Tax=Candidatus Agrococcus pullicola TaxID=2838429 RepID=A0A9D1YUI7_9MICO|nr:2-oxo acid dehydrogenase subunit E2 [Candidatus Agrococcus pullicola]
MTITFKLPDLGEGLTESEIVTWQIAEGDRVELNQTLAEVETAKAVVELPSPYEGIISKLHAGAGETVLVGAPLIDFDIDGDDSDSSTELPDTAEPEAIPEPADLAKRVATQAQEEQDSHDEQEAEKVDVLVGSITIDKNRPKRTPRAWDAEPFVRTERPASGPRVRSTPPVRAYAKQRGVDINDVPSRAEAVTRADIDAFLAAPAAEATTRGSRTERVAGIRKHTAAAMVKSVTEVPHAAVFLEVDVTDSLELVRDLKSAARGGASPSFLSLVSRAVIRASKLVPETNATFDAEAGEIRYHDFVNLGVAVATPKGLVVAGIEDADLMDATELTEAIAEKASRAREGKLSPAELTSSTLTISNVGVFGVDTGVPIINPGESAILALGTARKKPWEYRGDIALRDVLTLAVSFDHRLIDGAEASTFIKAIGDVLERPGLALAG